MSLKQTAVECVRDHTPCWHHRYSIVHCLPHDERVYDHSQGTWDKDLRGRADVETYPSRCYEHGMTASQLRERVAEYDRCREAGLPLLPYQAV